MKKSQENLLKEQFLTVINKLPHVATRVPYTYHHDYLRSHTIEFIDKSRAEVAELHCDDEYELYAVSLTYLLDNLGSKVFPLILSDDLVICVRAREVTDAVLFRYD